MTQTKDQQAQEYAEKKTAAAFDYVSPNIDTAENLKIPVFTGEQIKQAYTDGYTAAEQSLWRSVEEELPSNDDNVFVYVPSTEFRIGGYEVAYYDGEDWYTSDGEHIRPTHFMYIPSLHETNTEKK